MTPAGTKPAENREWIDFAKGVAIILVVLYHCSLLLNDVGLAGATPRIRSFLLFFPMPMFFFIAGLTARRSLTWSFPDLWRRRLLPLVYLYLLWSGIRVLYYLVVPSLRGFENLPTSPLNIALIPIWPTSSFWFIWALAIFSLVAWLARKLPPAVQIGAATVLAILSTTPGLLDTNNVGWDRVAQNLVFFIAAIYLPHLTYRLAARVRVWHAVALASVYVALALVIVLLNASRVPALILLESVVAVALGVAASTLLTRIRWLDFVSNIGRASLQVYLVHLFIIALVLALVRPVAEYDVLVRFGTLLPFLLAAAVLVLSMLLIKLLRPVYWLWVSPFSTGRWRRKARSRSAVVSGAQTPSATDPSGSEQRRPGESS